ncbi:MAG: hypothetical protein D6812_17370 [Deltaproteobacteria bacterium]|nr:MAG: hypothetical protein D6812_17370 [Deltaproteobacteria bacterium]
MARLLPLHIPTSISRILCLFCLGLSSGCYIWNVETRIEVVEAQMARMAQAEAKRCAPETFAEFAATIEATKRKLAQEGRFRAAAELHRSERLSREMEMRLRACQETDRDKDGIPDFLDGAADAPEDFDEFADEDGIPDPDNDNDGIPDPADRCPTIPEDFDLFADGDGCPDPDNDNDGIPDAEDADPDRAEDRDLFHDEDGIPDPDNDNDGIPDPEDLAPNSPETFNGYADEDGLPDAAPQRFSIRRPRMIEIRNPIAFAPGKSDLLPESFATLDEIAAILERFPDLRLEIIGYTDNRGDPKRNLRLSLKRAQRVKEYLRLKGISEGRLIATGKGAADPIAPNDTEEGRARNRRIEFRIR